MQDPHSGGEWDFTPVIDLIHSFSTISDGTIFRHESLQSNFEKDVADNGISESTLCLSAPSLGDFGTIWGSIGCQEKESSTNPRVKSVRWPDELDEIGEESKADDADESDLAGLTKSQRKKHRRRLRRQALAENLQNGAKAQSDIKATDWGSESESANENLKTPDRRALIQTLLDRPLPPKPESDGQALAAIHREKEKRERESEEKRTELVHAIAAAKRARVIELLQRRFIDDGPYLDGINDPQQFTFQDLLPPHDGIHVFIDASNILIGFHDTLKAFRSLPPTSRIPRQHISFSNLSMILVRGRPAAKGVIVGSDNVPELIEAKQIGYETSILDRVHKAKELTPRQKKFAHRENGAASAGSGSETTAAIAKLTSQKWVEQAVDEILHLKMMESLVDAAQPSTMVLATGDAAEAEFSAGFLRMIERALEKGWRVELACWSRNMSSAYRKKSFRQKWGKKFMIVELDDFVDMLLEAK